MVAANKAPRLLGPDGIARTPDKEAELNKLFAGIFGSEGGREVMRYLRSITIESVAGPHITPNELMHREGMRYLVGIMEQRIAGGRNGR